MYGEYTVLLKMIGRVIAHWCATICSAVFVSIPPDNESRQVLAHIAGKVAVRGFKNWARFWANPRDIWAKHWRFSFVLDAPVSDLCDLRSTTESGAVGRTDDVAVVAVRAAETLQVVVLHSCGEGNEQ